MDVGAAVPLADPVNTGQALAVCCVVEIFAIVDASVGCCKCDSQACGVNLCKKYFCFRIRLELRHNRPPVLNLNISVNAGEADLFLLQARAYEVYLRPEPAKDNKLLSGAYDVIV